MEGFFSKKELKSETGEKKLTCVKCGRYSKCNFPKIPEQGNFKKGIINILPFPSVVDDNKKEGFINKEARFLRKIYKEFGVDFDEDCLNLYTVKCYSKTPPTPLQYDACKRFLLKIIQEKKPNLIISYGKNTLNSLIGDRWKKDFGEFNRWRGWQIPDQDLKTFLCPVFTPQSIIYSEGAEEIIFKQDLKKAFNCLQKPFPKFVEPKIIYLDEDLTELNNIKPYKIAFDYETTGIKPHSKEQKIICASVAVSSDKVYSFMIPNTPKKRSPFLNLLQDKSIMKIAHNMKYENNWTETKLRTKINNWSFDTMMAAHIVDNRGKSKSLKFQAYIQFGVVDYDSEISEYLDTPPNIKKEEKSGNTLNRIHELLNKPQGKEKLLKYCAWDSILEFRLEELWKSKMLGTIGETEISPTFSNFPQAYNLLHNGILALSGAEQNGLRINVEYCEKQKNILTRKILRIERKFKETSFFKDWQKSVGSKTVNIDSGPQLSHFLYSYKNIKPKKLTKKEQGSTDEEALKLLKIKELDLLLDRSKLMKIRDTYLKGLFKEQVNGVIHPNFNLHTVDTYRSSCTSPNFQNIPKRDKLAMKTVRGAIYPSPGNQLMEADFSQLEVGIAACYHKDPTMLEYLNNGVDFHALITGQVFKIKNFDKRIEGHNYARKCIKNSFVFPQFYGDYYKNNAIAVCQQWMDLPQRRWTKEHGVNLYDNVTTAEHLIKNGINSFSSFENHLKQIEKDFWENRFPIYKKWKESHYQQYLKLGYISLFTGFVCRGVLSRNQSINYPVQGAAFHCLLWTFIEVSKRLKKLGMKSKLVGQIHDAIVFDVFPPELNQLANIVHEIATVKIKKFYKWIIVPLEIEFELCPVDKPWSMKEDWKPEFLK